MRKNIRKRIKRFLTSDVSDSLYALELRIILLEEYYILFV